MRRVACILVLLIWLPFMPGCWGSRAENAGTAQAKKEILNEPLPEDEEDLQKYIHTLHLRLNQAEDQLERTRQEALQAKIWIGVGACVLAGLVLIALGIWTTRRVLVEFGLAALGLAALGMVAAWLVPYMLWIGIALVVVITGVVIFMLANRERALKQVSNAVDEAKERIPQFKQGYRDIFRGHIDTAMDRVVNSVRGVKSK